MMRKKPIMKKRSYPTDLYQEKSYFRKTFWKNFFWKENAKSLSAFEFTEEACGPSGIGQPP